MRNIFNSFTGSFFRTIGRILAYAAIGLILAYFAGFINIGNVNAATRVPNEVTFGGYSLPRTISINTTGVSNSLAATLSSAYAYSYDYAVVEICSTVGLEATVYNNAYNYYFNDTSYLYNTGRGCTSSGISGEIYYLFLSVGQWDIGSGNVSLYQVASYIRLRSTWGYNGYATIQNFLFSDEDMSIDIQQNQNIVNTIDSAFNDLDNSITEGFEDITGAVDGVGDKVQETTDKVQDTNDKLDDLNDNITDSDTSSSEDLAGGFFEDFDNEDYGLSDIITMPLQVINNITSATCSPLELPLPFVDTDVTLPCMYDIYEDHFGGFLTIYQTITFGIVSYWVCINIFRMVKNFKNPDNDEVEVLDL